MTTGFWLGGAGLLTALVIGVEPAYYKVGVDEIAKEFKEDESAARRKYSPRSARIEITGKVAEINTALNCVVLKTEVKGIEVILKVSAKLPAGDFKSVEAMSGTFQEFKDGKIIIQHKAARLSK